MVRSVKWPVLLLMLLAGPGNLLAQGNTALAESPSDPRVKELQDQLSVVLQQLAETRAEVRSLAAEVRTLRGQAQPAGSALSTASADPPIQSSVVATSKSDAPAAASAPPPTAQSAFVDRIVNFGLDGDERGNALSAKPEIFVQTRYSTLPIDGATIRDFPSNFRVARAEMRWSGRINSWFGGGVELQYHPANDGDPTQIINDAFLQFYPTDHLTITGGQFVLPFGFDIQQSTSRRESPERAMFAGYFFPGQRDRGVMVQGNLDSLKVPALNGVDYYAGVFNGNRFWTDNNRQLNYVVRVRKHSEAIHLSAGVSGQIGHQLLPHGAIRSDRQNIIGFDVQWALRRFGLRAEMVAGDMPSTLLSITPAFAPQFRLGRHAVGGTVFATYRITGRDNVYVRYDQLNRDLVNGLNIRAVNWGYLRELSANSHIAVDFQQKNHLSFNDDAVNSQLQVTWGVVF
jgi:hypothetical protein